MGWAVYLCPCNNKGRMLEGIGLPLSPKFRPAREKLATQSVFICPAFYLSLCMSFTCFISSGAYIPTG